VVHLKETEPTYLKNDDVDDLFANDRREHGERRYDGRLYNNY
jgi:hypothetical protein